LAGGKDQIFQLALGNHESADRVIVNTDDPSAMMVWNEFRQVFPENWVVLASAAPVFESDNDCIKRPLIASSCMGFWRWGSRRRLSRPGSPNSKCSRRAFYLVTWRPLIWK